MVGVKVSIAVPPHGGRAAIAARLIAANSLVNRVLRSASVAALSTRLIAAMGRSLYPNSSARISSRL